MRKLILFLLMCTVFSFSFSAKTTKAPKKEKVKAPVYKVYSGEYIKASNTFSFKKDNLIFPNKTVIYQVKDLNNSIENVYKFLRSDYEVKDNQKVGLEVVGIINKGTLEVYRVNNYTIPQDNIKARENYILFGQ